MRLPAVALLCCLTAAGASAAGQTLTFDDALGRAARAPLVTGAERAVAAKRALDARISRLTANPQINLQAGYRALPVPDRGVEGEVGVQQPLNLAGYGGARRRSAAAETAQLGAEARAIALASRAAAARAWIARFGAEQALREAAREVELAAELAERTARAAAAGVLLRVDGSEARAYLAEARLAHLTLQGEVLELSVELARAVHLPPERPLTLAGPLPAPPLPGADALPRLLACAAALPEAESRRLAAAAERARAAEVRASRGAQLQLGALLVREAPTSLSALGTATLTLPLFDRGERDRAPLAAAAERAAGEAEAQADAARAALVLGYHEVEHSGEVLASLERELVPGAEEAAALREAALRAGQSTMVELLLARRAAAAARGRLQRARAAHASARVRLALLLGELPCGKGGAP